jgi:transcriptional regulator with XRE-family HTH domain
MTVEDLRLKLHIRRNLPPPEELRRLREAAGASLADVASVIGSTRQAVQLWETGKREPYWRYLETYAAVLEMFREEIASRNGDGA